MHETGTGQQVPQLHERLMMMMMMMMITEVLGTDTHSTYYLTLKHTERFAMGTLCTHTELIFKEKIDSLDVVSL